MRSEKTRFILLLLIGLMFFAPVFSQDTKKDQQVLEGAIDLLQRYFEQQNEWHVVQPQVSKNVKGLIHFIEDEPLDSILQSLGKVAEDTSFRFVYRLPENVSDSLLIPGYYPASKVKKDIEQIGADLRKEFKTREATVPVALISDIEKKVKIIPPGKGHLLFSDSIYVLPEKFKQYEVIPDSVLDSPVRFRQYLKQDSLRNDYIEKKRIAYNDSLINAYRDSVVTRYRNQQFDNEHTFRVKQLLDSVKLNNYEVLKNYNENVIEAVNDSIQNVIKVLADYAMYIDTNRVVFKNLTNDRASLLLSRNGSDVTRFWLKNEQNDSLSVLIKNLDRNQMQMFIDDGVTFSRFSTRETKAFDFRSLGSNMAGLTNVGKRYEVNTPWRIGGDGNVGFTQTYLENWKKGGKSALSLLVVLEGFANYSSKKGKIKWENSGEIRNGWIRQGDDKAELQKNDDRFEITSRFGVSAFKKWYYSAEFNYETQLFNGYNYPKSNNPDPISAFMAPARTFFKLGLDYKPNKNFSLLISPITLKNVYVRDTMKIDQTKFGIDEGSKSFWETGLNADVTYKTNLTSDISYETKYKMFINYNSPFSRYDINWENQLVMKVNNHINMRLLVHMVYDDDVLFPIYDANEVKIGEGPKLQVKELITVGFVYKINKQVTRTRRLN